MIENTHELSSDQSALSGHLLSDMMRNSFYTQWPMVYVELVAPCCPSGKETSHV
jgi:hypothetical protein